MVLRSIRPLVQLLVVTAFYCSSIPAHAQQILEIDSTTLTTYQAEETHIQDVRPLAEQRGVRIEGSLRSPSTFRMAIQGNPFEQVWRGTEAINGLRLDTGTYSVTDVDISLPAEGFAWVIGRTYNARQKTSGGSHRDSNGYQGKNWFQTSQPEIKYYNDAVDANDCVYLVWGADRFAEFERANSTSTEFQGTNGAAGCFQFAEGSGSEPDTFTYTDQNGYEFVFFGFDTDADPAKGQLWKIIDVDDNTAYVGDKTTASTAISSGFDSAGRITTAYDSSERRFSYTYSTTEIGGAKRLEEVVAETKTGATWASPGTVTEVAKVEYNYYGDESYGDEGDLKTVALTTPLSDSGVNDVRTKYYRYWEGTFNASTNPGHPHALKLILDYEGARNFDYSETGGSEPEFDNGFESASHSSLETYAVAYFEYDSEHRVDEAFFNGQCGCGGGSDGTHYFEYETNGSYTDNSGYDTTWARRTVVQRPDSTYLTQYFDETGQALHQVITDDDPDNTSPAPDKWVTKITRSSSGMVTDRYWPDSVTAYTHSTGAITVSTSAGLVRTYQRVSSGNMTDFFESQKFQKGDSGTEYFEDKKTYTSVSLTIGDVTVVRPLISGSRVYSEEITSGTSGSYETTYAYTAYSSELAIEKVTTTLPAVSTGNNGSGSANTSLVHYDEDGKIDFQKDEDGIITYREYSDGQITKLVEDADTTSLSPPTGFSSSGTELDWTTAYTYDDQGRRETTTRPGGRVMKSYVSTLADRRIVRLDYNGYDASPEKFYGPVGYSVTNHAGKPEASGRVALTSNETTTATTGHIDETDDDPVTAADLGSVVRLTTSHYDDSGEQLQESRLYFDVPASLPGTDGTNYDPTLYGYNDSGRKWRTKHAHGTIYRTVFDILGRTTERWMGTNDSTFSGGEASGTDNMVKTEALIYDSGNDDGNGFLTKRTLYVEDSTTDQRVWDFTNDLRGRQVLVDAPEKPHTFNEFDNMGRQVASGMFSSTASIVVGTDDPTTEATNRLALNQTFFDELGRVWKTQGHEIDASDGSDDDNLPYETWYDATGLVVKRDADQLVKYAYDRIGRRTHQHILVVDDDTAYADVDDISGDIVIEENQTTYDTSDGTVIMVARIDRLHNDYGGSETTGALDTNADSDDLLYTAANLEGRIQITAHWYDDLDRLTTTGQYGTYGGSNFDRDGLSEPSSSSGTVIVTQQSYATDGSVQDTTDPRGIVTRYEVDDAGRQTAVIRNYDSGVNGGDPSGTDDNVTVEYEYTDGLRTLIAARMPSSSDDQETTYTFGTTKGAGSNDSEISTGHLLYKIVFPGSTSDDDAQLFAYNAQGQTTKKKVGDLGTPTVNVLEWNFDDVGREEHERATTTAAGFDTAVLRISTAYTDLGQAETVTQYDNATVGSGSVVDEVKYTYDGWGNVTTFEQDRNSAVAPSAGDEYEVSYAYEKALAGRNTIRRTQMTMPDGQAYYYVYTGGNDRHDRDLSRVGQIKEDTTVLVNYEYLGQDLVIGTTLEEPDIFQKRYSGTTYPDLDRWNRVTDDRWTKDLTTDVDFHDLDITYDYSSNITQVVDNVQVGFDRIWDIDDIDRVTRQDEGTESSGSITSRTRDQQWTLTHAGNWDVEQLDLNGDSDFVDTDEHDDDRTYNKVNELTARDTDDNGTDDFTLTYDVAGNLTDDDEDYEYVYDAWNRLRKIQDTSDQSLVAEYNYNGLAYRIAEHADTDDDGDVDGADEWHYFANDTSRRIVAMLVDSDTAPTKQYVHHNAGADGFGGSLYVDLIVLRDRDTTGNGALNERLYYGQDLAAGVSTIFTGAGRPKEHVRYFAYGTPFGLPAADTDSSSPLKKCPAGG